MHIVVPGVVFGRPGSDRREQKQLFSPRPGKANSFAQTIGAQSRLSYFWSLH
jgi:hypothetical protein